ncbi:phosphatidylglycerophosphatase and protein-tyrosine phosphatase 1 [Latimeria chalumnae]|uniref:Phosphatidylglycerophosphatase and protein-tyrosine phosphatase 1 n=1 Tax=Latimeria chalumnae TaxID=7897 RepID=H3BI97_LATCH|nr:PREDICTED: phosphatidylglycerophosphatase and protein-tyrosine phosphatase 1 [Latimeria chalumnae]|eukprot:XP_005987012.1 PREDICTED: phosphatidylglycerophosphatase and protein-tyrosine phosphatase 1 [Latimeria chalumnae]
MAWLTARVLFYPTLVYNMVLEKVSWRRWYDRIDETLILGALPFRSMTKELVEKENVRGVITMNEEYETRFFCNSAEEWQAAGVEQLHLSTVDLTGVPSLENLRKGVDFLLKHREKGNGVYVHCKAGRSRSATMAAAYLIELRSWTPREACEFLASIRPHILVRHRQQEVLQEFHQKVCSADPQQKVA